MYRPNNLIYHEFVISSATGSAVNADGLPVGKLARNGTDDGAVTVTITNVDTGRYKAAFTIPGTYSRGDSIALSIAATISSIAAKNVVMNGVIDQGIDLTQPMSMSNTAGTVGDSLNAARAWGFGREQQVGNTLNLYGWDGATIVRSFTLDNPSAPTSRT